MNVRIYCIRKQEQEKYNETQRELRMEAENPELGN
jgi:hypothetical protein